MGDYVLYLYPKLGCAAAGIAAKGAAESAAEPGGGFWLAARACGIAWIKLLITLNSPAIFSVSIPESIRRVYFAAKHGLSTTPERCRCLVGEGS